MLAAGFRALPFAHKPGLKPMMIFLVSHPACCTQVWLNEQIS
jgi:hypothetical protein